MPFHESDSSLNNIPLTGRTTLYLSIHLLRDILVAPKFSYEKTEVQSGYPKSYSPKWQVWDSNLGLIPEVMNFPFFCWSLSTKLCPFRAHCFVLFWCLA